MPDAPVDIDAYLAALPEASAAVVAEIRRRVHAVVPDAEETISYAIPTFTRGGTAFVHVAGWAKHVSLYPVPDVDPALAQEIAPYLSGQSTLKVPLREPFPYDVVEAVVAVLAEQRAPL